MDHQTENKKRRISLRWQLLAGVVLTAIGTLLIYIFFMKWTQWIYVYGNLGYVPVYIIYDYSDLLTEEAYEEVPAKALEENMFIVYDTAGTVVYQSDPNLRIPFDIVQFYVKHYSDYFLDNQVDFGPLYYGNDSFIVADQFTTASGEQRLYAEVIPYHNEIVNARAQEEVGRITVLGVIAEAVWIFLMAMLMGWYFRRSLRPVNEAIQAYQNGTRPQVAKTKIPGEFQGLLDNLNSMMNRMEQAQERQHRAEEARNRMIADLSHDLKTPLTVISGYSGAMLDGVVPERDKDVYIKTIHQKALYTSGLMDDLFEYSKMEHPDYVLTKENVDYCEFCREFLGEKYSELELQGFLIHAQIPETPIYLQLDKALYRRLLENLVLNIQKHNPPGTNIYFRVFSGMDQTVTLIADDGVGIPEEVKARLFEPFVKGDEARTTGQGSGLGMVVARKIVELHEGTIKLADPPQEPFSTEFRICLKN